MITRLLDINHMNEIITQKGTKNSEEIELCLIKIVYSVRSK